MHRSHLTLLLLLLFILHFQIVSGQSKTQLLTKSLEQFFERDSLPGMSVVLVNAQKIIYQQNFGYADVEQKIKYSTGSIQNIGSVSKTFIAVALMKAIKLGYFNLDTDINTILPFKVVHPSHPAAVITIRQLSNHTSGIIDNPAVFPNVYHFKTDLAPYDTAAYRILQNLGYQQQLPNESLQLFMRNYLAKDGKYYHKENFGPDAPGIASHYSNIASALVAELIEIKSGMSYAAFTTKYILEPLKMNHSGWELNAGNLKAYARPYYNRNAVFPYYDFITYPEGGLRTNTADLSKYLMALIKGYHNGLTWLNKSSFDAMFTPQFSSDNPPKGINLSNRNKGIFWNLYTRGPIGHDGDDPGVSTFLFFNPKTNVGGIFLCNKYLADKSEIINILFKYAQEE